MDADINEISGKREQLIGKVETVYGITNREADKQVWDWGKSVERNKRRLLRSPSYRRVGRIL